MSFSEKKFFLAGYTVDQTYTDIFFEVEWRSNIG
jgi:hypothetical protein